MASDPLYRALFLGAGPQMQCGVGQFTRHLHETIEKLEPGTTATLTLTREEGSLGEIWRAVGLGTERGLQLSDRRLEARDLRAPAGARDGAAATTQDCPDSARMGRAALAAPAHLYPGTAAGRYHRHVLAAGAARTRGAIPCSAGPRRRPCWRRCRRTSRRRRALRFETAPSAGRRASDKRLIIGHFGSIYPGKQPEALLEIGSDPEAARAQAADRLYRLLHPRHRQCRAGVPCPRRRTRSVRRCHRQRLRRLGSRSVRPARRGRRLLLSARRGTDRAALQHSRLRAIRPAADRHRACPAG